MFFKQWVLKASSALALLAGLLGGGAALGTHTSAVKAAPAGSHLACVEIMLPPC